MVGQELLAEGVRRFRARLVPRRLGLVALDEAEQRLAVCSARSVEAEAHAARAAALGRPVELFEDALLVAAHGRQPAELWHVDLAAGDRVRLSPQIEVTDMPHAESFGVRLLGDVSVDIVRGFSATLRGGYQARRSTSGGPAFGGTLNMAF